tara:strand:- start:41 stop:1744 length:1704 start_codon:yes stop_codon:yes gene_type:complete
MTNYTESELIPFALAAIQETPKGLETQNLIKKLVKSMKPNGEDKIILINRTDDKFSQKVRNLKSHKTLEKKEYVIFKDNKFFITDKGVSYLRNHSSLINNIIEITKHKVENFNERIDFDDLLTKVLSTLTPKEENIFRRRFGINTHSHTLEEIGKIFKVTRERIRQIEAKLLRKLKHPARGKMMKSVLVKIDEVLNSVSNILNEEEFIKKLEKKNISLKSLRLLRIIFNVYDFRQEKIHYFRGRNYVAESHSLFNSFLLFINKYYKSVRTKNGIINVNLLHSELRRKNFIVSSTIVKNLIKNRNGYYITEEYFIPNTKGKNNRLTGVIKFTMSVSDKIEVDELIDCIKRSRNSEIFSPPAEILKILCEKLGYQVEDNYILNKNYSENNQHLTGNNKALFKMFIENNRLMTYEEVLEANKKHKININSLNVLLYQNLFVQPRRMIFALAGTKLNDEYLDEIDQKRQNYIKETIDKVKYSQGTINGSIIINFPKIHSHKPYMWMNPDYYNLIPEGQYEVSINNSKQHLNIFKNRIWFKQIFFKNLDLENDDSIELSIDIIEKKATFVKV